MASRVSVAGLLLVLVQLPASVAEPPFGPGSLFQFKEIALGIPVHGPDEASVARVASTVTRVLHRAASRVAAGLVQQEVALYIISGEEALETVPGLLEYLLESRPLELIYTDIEGVDETLDQHQGTVAQKLMQLFAYYPLEEDPECSDLKSELEHAFGAAILPRDEIGGLPLYDANDYSQPDDAHPHMGPPYYTAPGAYLGLGYEVRFGLTQYQRGETEYYPISHEEMIRWDPALVAFLDRYMD